MEKVYRNGIFKCPNCKHRGEDFYTVRTNILIANGFWTGEETDVPVCCSKCGVVFLALTQESEE